MIREAQNQAKGILALYQPRISVGSVTDLEKQCCQVWYPEQEKNISFVTAKHSFWGDHTVFICGFILGNRCQHFALVKLALGSVYGFTCVLCLYVLVNTIITFNTTDRHGTPRHEVSILSMHAGTFWWCNRPALIFTKKKTRSMLLVKAGSSLSECWAYYRLMRPANGQQLLLTERFVNTACFLFYRSVSPA